MQQMRTSVIHGVSRQRREGMGGKAGNVQFGEAQCNKSRRPLSRKNLNSHRNSSAETGEIPVFIARIRTLSSGILLRLDFRNRRTQQSWLLKSNRFGTKCES